MVFTKLGLKMNIIGTHDLGDGKTSLTIECNCCQRAKELVVNSDDLKRWNMGRGEFVQKCFPYLSDDERELFVSGTCGECFDRMFPPDDDDE